MDNLQFESANFIKRLCAFVIDLIIIAIIWYVISINNFKEIEEFMKELDPNIEGSLEIFKDVITKFWVKFLLKFIFAKVTYYLLVPAIIGSGKTVGKFLCGLSMVSYSNLEEIKPLNLIYREVVCRLVIEDLLVIPGIVSCIIALVRKDSRSLHDLMAKTVVITRGMSDVSTI